MKRKPAIIIFLIVCAVALALGLAACSNGASLYVLYREAYIQANGTEDGLLNENEWLLSSNGNGGKSAYDLYVDAFIEKNGSAEGALTEADWLNALKGDQGVGISSIDIVCGNIIIYLDNGSVEELENMLPEAGHNWDDGEISSVASCISPGVITFHCIDCDASKKELVDSNDRHAYGEYETNATAHWRICKLCGDKLTDEHDFSDKTAESDANEILECECGITKTVGEFYSYKVTFECDNGATVAIYNTQDYSVDGISSTTAYARHGTTGALLNNGDGQVNFEIIPALGYRLKEIKIAPNGYKNLKDDEETGRANTYRITKITAELTVTIETEIDIIDLPVMSIRTANNAPIVDKENYVDCVVSVLGAETQYCVTAANAGIRGRGNTTWELNKKPYKLKFSSKIDLFGNGAAKKWTLIANYSDPSLLRSYLTFSIAGENGVLNNVKFTTTTQFVELYLNGQYLGVYLVCEQNEVGSNRVDIDESLTDDNGETKVNTGYLLESDNAYTPSEGIDGLDYFIVDGVYYAIKSPDTEDKYYIEHKDEFVAFIKNIVQTAVDSLNEWESSPENFSAISELLDIPSFVDGYLIDELTNTPDGSYSSFYIYYDNADGKLHRGPIWDYDGSCGNAAYKDSVGYNNPEFLRASLIFWYNRLLNFDGFRQAVADRLTEISEDDSFMEFLDNKVEEIIACGDSFNRNFEKWDDVLGQDNLSHWNTEEIIALSTWQEQVEYLVEWLKTSYNYIVSVYCQSDY